MEWIKIECLNEELKRFETSDNLENAEKEWIKTEDGFEYEHIRKNGHWQVFRWKHHIEIYSYCPFCGHVHNSGAIVIKEDGSWRPLVEYDAENEFNYCPMCGEDMEVIHE